MDTRPPNNLMRQTSLPGYDALPRQYDIILPGTALTQTAPGVLYPGPAWSNVAPAKNGTPPQKGPQNENWVRFVRPGRPLG